jgi:hypothetical protein
MIIYSCFNDMTCFKSTFFSLVFDVLQCMNYCCCCHCRHYHCRHFIVVVIDVNYYYMYMHDIKVLSLDDCDVKNADVPLCSSLKECAAHAKARFWYH